MEKTVLLGFTKDNEVVFGNVSYKNGRFTASFDSSYPMEISKEYAIQSIESTIDCMEKDWILNELETHDCRPSELAEKLYENSYDVVGEFMDNSLYTESFSIDGVDDDIYFLAGGCGQHDTRNEMAIYINQELYNEIHRLWDEYHLKQVDYEEVKDVFEAIDHQNNTIDEYRVVENWLKKVFK